MAHLLSHQVNSSAERRILFSVWDPRSGGGTTTLVRAGEDVIAQRFGGEGEGGQSFLRFNWAPGTTYRFLTRSTPGAEGQALFSAWFFAPERSSWMFLATWASPCTRAGLRDVYSFLENFEVENGAAERQAVYANQWACSESSGWVELTSAEFTCDATAQNRQRGDFSGGGVDGGFFLRNGGFFYPEVPSSVGATILRSPSGRAPEVPDAP